MVVSMEQAWLVLRFISEVQARELAGVASVVRVNRVLSLVYLVLQLERLLRQVF